MQLQGCKARLRQPVLSCYAARCYQHPDALGRARVQKERRLTGLHKDIEELLFDPDSKGAVGE